MTGTSQDSIYAMRPWVLMGLSASQASLTVKKALDSMRGDRGLQIGLLFVVAAE